MGDEFPCARRELTEQGSDGRRIEASGGQYADGAIGGDEALFRDDAVEGRLEPAQKAHLRTAKQGRAGSCMQAPGGLKRVADGADSSGSRGSQYGSQDGGKHVDVLVGVNVREAEPTAFEQGDLGSGFGLNSGRDLSARGQSGGGTVEQTKKASECGTESPGNWVGQGWDFAMGGKHRLAINQNQMAADAERGHGERYFDCIAGARSVGHERGAGQDAGLVQLRHRAVDSARQAEVVRVDDEAPHRVSLSTLRGVH